MEYDVNWIYLAQDKHTSWATIGVSRSIILYRVVCLRLYVHIVQLNAKIVYCVSECVNVREDGADIF